MSDSDSTKEIMSILINQAGNGMRVGQVMSNIFYKISEDGSDPFYVDDKKLLKYLKEYIDG